MKSEVPVTGYVKDLSGLKNRIPYEVPLGFISVTLYTIITFNRTQLFLSKTNKIEMK